MGKIQFDACVCVCVCVSLQERIYPFRGMTTTMLMMINFNVWWVQIKKGLTCICMLPIQQQQRHFLCVYYHHYWVRVLWRAQYKNVSIFIIAGWLTHFWGQHFKPMSNICENHFIQKKISLTINFGEVKILPINWWWWQNFFGTIAHAVWCKLLFALLLLSLLLLLTHAIVIKWIIARMMI